MSCLCVGLALWVGAAGAQTGSLDQGIQLYGQGAHAQAAEVLERFVAGNPGSAEGYYYLGLAQQALGEVQPALRALSRAAELDPELPAVHTNLGILRYQTGDLSGAAEALERAVAADTTDGAAHLFLGLVRQAQGDYTASVRSFRAAAHADPDFAQLAALNRGVSHLRAGEKGEARTALEEAIALDDDPDTTARARELLEQTGLEAAPRKPWTVTASVGLQFDDNVTVDAVDTSTGLEDFAVLFDAGVSYALMPAPGLELEFGYDFSQTLYFDLSDLDLQTHTASAYGSTEVAGADVSLIYSYSRSFLGGDDFLGLHYVAPTVGYSITPALYGSLTYSYQNKNFVADSARDADTHGIGLMAYWFFPGRQSYVQAGIRYDDEDAEGPEFDYTAWNYQLGLKLPIAALPRAPIFRVDYKYYDRDYENVTPSIGEDRSDQRHAIKLRLIVPLFRYVEAELAYEYIDSESNLPSSDFEENIVTGQLNARF